MKNTAVVLKAMSDAQEILSHVQSLEVHTKLLAAIEALGRAEGLNNFELADVEQMAHLERYRVEKLLAVKA